VKSYVLCDFSLAITNKTFASLAKWVCERIQLASIAPVPGTGGIDVDALRDKGVSRRHKPVDSVAESLQCPWSKALPFSKHLKMCGDQIQQFEFIYLRAHRRHKPGIWRSGGNQGTLSHRWARAA
jgi:hypothetical protein